MLKVILNKTLEKKNINDFSTLKNQSLNMDNLENYYSEYEKTTNLIKYGNNTKNNFVNAFLQAYNYHKTLRLRPDDIKLQLLMIISTFINNNAEMMRPFFVDHKGKKELTVFFDAFKPNQIFGEFGRQLEGNIKCPEFAKHYKHKFSTTTELISVVNNMTLMNTLKEYFEFTMICMCGIPSVELEGTQEDWNELKQTYEYFKGITGQYELKEWYNHFDVIMDMFIEMRMLQESGTIDAPDHIKKLWERVISYIPVGSGGDTKLAGWIRLFCPYSSSMKLIDGLDKNLECFNIDSEPLLYWYKRGDDWNTVPSSIVITPATMKFDQGEEELTSYKVEIHSGFYIPYYNMDDDTIEMNIGFKIKEAEDVEYDRMTKHYEKKGVYVKGNTIMIPKVLRKERDNIYKYISGTKHMRTEYYGADPEQEATKEYYLSNGVIIESKYNITAPSKFKDEVDKIKDAFDVIGYCKFNYIYSEN
jgi:hypothetical protein